MPDTSAGKWQHTSRWRRASGASIPANLVGTVAFAFAIELDGRTVTAVQTKAGAAYTYYAQDLLDTQNHKYKPIGLKRHATAVVLRHLGLRGKRRSRWDAKAAAAVADAFAAPASTPTHKPAVVITLRGSSDPLTRCILAATEAIMQGDDVTISALKP